MKNSFVSAKKIQRDMIIEKYFDKKSKLDLNTGDVVKLGIKIDEGKNEKNIFEMAGSGFESTVRLAKSSPKMWRHIFEDNKLNITEALDDYIYNLNNIRELINDNKFDELETELKKINYIKNILNGINL